MCYKSMYLSFPSFLECSLVVIVRDVPIQENIIPLEIQIASLPGLLNCHCAHLAVHGMSQSWKFLSTLRGKLDFGTMSQATTFCR